VLRPKKVDSLGECITGASESKTSFVGRGITLCLGVSMSRGARWRKAGGNGCLMRDCVRGGRM
jgi:hypothetical protein